VSVITTLVPSLGGGSVSQRLGGAPPPSGAIETWPSKPGEIQSAGPLSSGSLTLLWSGTGYCMVMPTGCWSPPISRSYRLTRPITQYCQLVESPIRVGMEDPSGSWTLSASAPDDSFATS
jgi:hypothetical protein